jgi:hypothetical protein
MRLREFTAGLGSAAASSLLCHPGPGIASASGLSANAERRYHPRRLGVRRGNLLQGKRRP